MEKFILFLALSIIIGIITYIIFGNSPLILSFLLSIIASLIFFYKNENSLIQIFLFLFLSTFLLASILNNLFPKFFSSVLEEVKSSKPLNYSFFEILKTIFTHNFTLYLQAFLLSSLTFIGGFLFFFWNTLLFSAIVINSQYPFFTFIILAPHGILEFFSFYLASISGTKIFKNLILKEEISKEEILKMFLLGILILFIAALIEVFIILA